MCNLFLLSRRIHGELCDRCDDTRLRSATRGNFAERRTRLRVTDKAFLVAGPRAWNALPADIKLTDSGLTFRRKRKSYLLNLVVRLLRLYILSYFIVLLYLF